jgi:hypothetical protein
MKKAIVGCLMSSGLLLANGAKLSGNDRIALATSSPPVHVQTKHHKKHMDRTADRVVTDKTTIDAFVPVGK